jgi:hypothetical protein
MTRDEALDLLRFRLGNLRGHDEALLLELRAAQDRLEKLPELPWFLTKRDTSVSTTSGIDSVTLPSDFLRENIDWGFWVVDAEGTEHHLVAMDFVDFHTKRVDEDTDNALPENYDLLGESSLYLFPTPDAAYSLVLYYYAKATALTSNVENVWLKHYPDLLISEAGVTVARTLRDASAQVFFKEALVTELARLSTENVARREAGRLRELGG